MEDGNGRTRNEKSLGRGAGLLRASQVMVKALNFSFKIGSQWMC